MLKTAIHSTLLMLLFINTALADQSLKNAIEAFRKENNKAVEAINLSFRKNEENEKKIIRQIRQTCTYLITNEKNLTGYWQEKQGHEDSIQQVFFSAENTLTYTSIQRKPGSQIQHVVVKKNHYLLCGKGSKKYLFVTNDLIHSGDISGQLAEYTIQHNTLRLIQPPAGPRKQDYTNTYTRIE